MKLETVHDVKLWPENDMVVRRYRKEGHFEDRPMRVWKSALAGGGTAVDVGAYTGLYSIAAAMIDGVHAVAIEPNEHAAERMTVNADLNQVDFTIIRAALMDAPGRGSLHLKGGRNLTSAGSLVTPHGPHRRVSCITLDSLGLENVMAIKIDAERAEHLVVAGGLETIARDRPVIITEVLEASMLDRLSELLQPIGYRPVDLTTSMVSWKPENGS